MSHHGNDSDDLKRMLLGGVSKQSERSRHIDKLFKQLGPTRQYPDGLMSRTDEGGIRMAVTNSQDKIILAFGKEVAWIGFNPSDARALAKSLIDNADEVEREQERRSKL